MAISHRKLAWRKPHIPVDELVTSIIQLDEYFYVRFKSRVFKTRGPGQFSKQSSGLSFPGMHTWDQATVWWWSESLDNSHVSKKLWPTLCFVGNESKLTKYKHNQNHITWNNSNKMHVEKLLQKLQCYVPAWTKSTNYFLYNLYAYNRPNSTL